MIVFCKTTLLQRLNVQLKERNEVSKAMKPDRFTITTKKLDFMKLNEKIRAYELEMDINHICL